MIGDMEASITVVADNIAPYLRDYAPDEIVSESLLKSVLDCHEAFVPIASYKKPTRGANKKDYLVWLLMLLKRRVDFSVFKSNSHFNEILYI